MDVNWSDKNLLLYISIRFRFYAKKASPQDNIPKGTITFDVTDYDKKGNFNKTSGVFTASKNGIYYFSVKDCIKGN